MAWIGRSQGVFKLRDSDNFCGSFLSVADAAEILAVSESAINGYAQWKHIEEQVDTQGELFGRIILATPAR